MTEDIIEPAMVEKTDVGEGGPLVQASSFYFMRNTCKLGRDFALGEGGECEGPLLIDRAQPGFLKFLKFETSRGIMYLGARFGAAMPWPGGN
jgi:hypothetical protein